MDELTRRIWLYLLKEKKEAFACFQRFFTQVERQIEWRVKILRIDGGVEYNSKEFGEFYAIKGIEHEVITPYTPQHNGLAERRNKML